MPSTSEQPSASPSLAPETTDRFLDPSIAAPQPWERLGAFLGQHGMTLDAGVAPRQFSGGLGNLNYLVQVDGRPVVLRRPPAGPLPPGGNDMSREYRVLSRLWARFPLAPRALLFSDDESVLGSPFFLMEYRSGWVVRGKLPAPLRGSEAALSRMLVATLGKLHAVVPEEVDLGELGRPAGFLERAVEGWIKRAGVATDDAPPPIIRAIGDWLRAHRVPDPKPTLLHNDFKLDNVILDPKDPTRPIAVLDWDQCTRGDPLFDVATLLSYWTEASDPPELLEFGQMPTAEPGFLNRREVLDAYARETGRDVSNVLFHRVLCMFKLAVVLLQLHQRYRRGITKDERFHPLGRIANGVLTFTKEIADGRAF
ncbi:MAG: phosphotransferase family protein [Alphaproteobacteria bacterium]